MTASETADFARAASFLDRARLPAYVSFISRTSAQGVGDAEDVDQRLFVRSSDGKIVSGVPPADSHVVRTTNGDSANPFRDGGFFNPHCYAPKNEAEVRWNGRLTLRFELQPICTSAIGISELFVDPETFRPVAADGVIPDSENHVSTAVEMRFATIADHTVPTSIQAHTVGHGVLFWVRERTEVDYASYQFFSSKESTLRQASKTI